MDPQDNQHAARETGAGARETTQGTLPHTEPAANAPMAQDLGDREALQAAALVLEALRGLQQCQAVLLEQLPILMKRRK